MIIRGSTVTGVLYEQNEVLYFLHNDPVLAGAEPIGGIPDGYIRSWFLGSSTFKNEIMKENYIKPQRITYEEHRDN